MEGWKERGRGREGRREELGRAGERKEIGSEGGRIKNWNFIILSAATPT